MAKQMTIDRSIFEMALVGYEAQRNRIEAAMDEIKSELDGISVGPSNSASVATTGKGRKRLSIAARRRMALAQAKRWKAVKRQAAASAKAKRRPTTKRRKVAVVATKKRRVAPVKTAKKTTPKLKTPARRRKVVTKPKMETLVPQVQIPAEQAAAPSSTQSA